MTLTSQLAPESSVRKVEFRQLEPLPGQNPIDSLVEDFGVVYVTSITRDGCSGCQEQKPLYAQLATRMVEKHKGQVVFSNIHVRYRDDDTTESGESKGIFGHAAYPTYMVHVRSKFGPLEVYRRVYPTMEELEKQAADALELAEYYKTEAEKTGSQEF